MNGEIYIFGSLITGNIDSGSDVDVLVIDESRYRNKYPSDWSFYTQERILELFKQGTLFAWHVYTESICIHPKDSEGFLYSIGKPSNYGNARSEIDSLLRIAIDSVNELKNNSPSWVFELGLIYMATRDIAMAASMQILGEFCFDKYAPFFITGNQFPLNKKEYFQIMNCRRATTRGIDIKSGHTDFNPLINKLHSVVEWCEDIKSKVAL
jgi:hypothetical protein